MSFDTLRPMRPGTGKSMVLINPRVLAISAAKLVLGKLSVTFAAPPKAVPPFKTREASVIR
jgi:hypothetical protein